MRRAPTFRRFAVPLGLALITAVLGRRTSHVMQSDWGIWATISGTAILVGGLVASLWLWWRGQR